MRWFNSSKKNASALSKLSTNAGGDITEQGLRSNEPSAEGEERP